ncbi:MAG TPA: oligosaccharide flippase family protein [Elusimicrobiales bacterium]|nr:oligosaccharide flippase family protein [Elusimicrobiales bacterium]
MLEVIKRVLTGKVSLLKKNIAANFAGSAWQALMGLVFAPFYIKLMGVESWGLVGVFSMLQALFGLLDMGLSSTLNREMARLSVLPAKEREMRDLVRTLETLYWGVAVLIGIAVIALSPFIAQHWVKTVHLSANTVEQAILLMGFVMAIQMPIGFYSGGLLGLQKQVRLNLINGGISTLRGAGVALALWLVSPTIQAFFICQVVISALNVALLAVYLWRELPATGEKAAFRSRLLRGVWKFAAGMGGMTLIGAILTQLDKIILSKMLSLELFGYYTLAGIVAMNLNRFLGPVYSALYPRFTQLVSFNDEEGIRRLYHQSCQFLAVLLLPVALVVAAFSREILLLWTQDPVIAERTHLLVSVLICGTALNGLMYPTYILQLAFGWTKIGLQISSFLAVIFIPAIILLTRNFGAAGAASAWVALNIVYILIGVPLTHGKILKGEVRNWAVNMACPLAGILLTLLPGRYFIKTFIPGGTGLVYIPVMFAFALAGAVLFSRHIRSVIAWELAGGK